MELKPPEEHTNSVGSPSIVRVCIKCGEIWAVEKVNCEVFFFNIDKNSLK